MARGWRASSASPTIRDDPQWAHLLIEAATAAGYDRPEVLHERADGIALLAAIEARSSLIDPQRASRRPSPGRAGDTTYLCTADTHGMGVSLIQSNAAGFGSWLVEPNTGINLHNRGIGFALRPGHPAEYGPGRRPPHTLSPALATRGHDLLAVFGTMGGDAQPQILLQLAARLFHHGQSPATAVHAGRWALHGPQSGFDTWTAPEGPVLSIEGHAPDAWRTGLAQRGHVVQQGAAYDSALRSRPRDRDRAVRHARRRRRPPRPSRAPSPRSETAPFCLLQNAADGASEADRSRGFRRRAGRPR